MKAPSGRSDFVSTDAERDETNAVRLQLVGQQKSDAQVTAKLSHAILDPDSTGWASQMPGHEQETTTKKRYDRWIEIAKG